MRIAGQKIAKTGSVSGIALVVFVTTAAIAFRLIAPNPVVTGHVANLTQGKAAMSIPIVRQAAACPEFAGRLLPGERATATRTAVRRHVREVFASSRTLWNPVRWMVTARQHFVR